MEITILAGDTQLTLELPVGCQVSDIKERLRGTPQCTELGEFDLAFRGQDLHPSTALNVKALTLELRRGRHVQATKEPAELAKPTEATKEPEVLTPKPAGEATKTESEKTTGEPTTGTREEDGNDDSDETQSEKQQREAASPFMGRKYVLTSATGRTTVDSIYNMDWSNLPLGEQSKGVAEAQEARTANLKEDDDDDDDDDTLTTSVHPVHESSKEDLCVNDKVRVYSRSSGGKWLDASIIDFQICKDSGKPLTVYVQYCVDGKDCRKLLDISSDNLQIPPPHLRGRKTMSQSPDTSPGSRHSRATSRESLLALAAAEAVAALSKNRRQSLREAVATAEVSCRIAAIDAVENETEIASESRGFVAVSKQVEGKLREAETPEGESPQKGGRKSISRRHVDPDEVAKKYERPRRASTELLEKLEIRRASADAGVVMSPEAAAEALRVAPQPSVPEQGKRRTSVAGPELMAKLEKRRSIIDGLPPAIDNASSTA